MLDFHIHLQIVLSAETSDQWHEASKFPNCMCNQRCVGDMGELNIYEYIYIKKEKKKATSIRWL